MTASRCSFLLVLLAHSIPATLFGSSFEVASVELSANQNPIPGVAGAPPIPSGPVAVLSLQHATLQGMLFRAYSVPYNSIVGPAWMESVFYDVSAKVPPGAGRDSIAEMLRNLLTERFELRIREEKRPVNGWALVAEPSMKLKATPLPTDIADFDPDGLPGRRVSTRRRENEQTQIITGTSMQGIAKILSFQLGEPVQDGTALKGAFDITIQGEIGNPGQTPARIAPEFVMKSLRANGLNLVRQKVEIRTIRVDSANRNPKGN
jgi:uncharacterized protein (TIGR03435 family)